MSLANLITELADLRATIELAKDARERLELTEVGKQIVAVDEELKNLRREEKLLAGVIREDAPHLLEAHPAITIVESDVVHYDETAALYYCLDYMKLSLTLNCKMFETIARALGGIEAPGGQRIATVTKEPRARIARNFPR